MDSVERGQRKLDLAQRLTNALASENVRWAENIVTMEVHIYLCVCVCVYLCIYIYKYLYVYIYIYI
jgi:hypothetical protein